MAVPVLKQGEILVATIPSTVTDADWRRLQDVLLEKVGRLRCSGVVLDVSDLDVLDSFATRMLRDIADMARLRGARTVIVGIQPDVAFVIVQLGMDTGSLVTALDLEEGLEYLATPAAPPVPRW